MLTAENCFLILKEFWIRSDFEKVRAEESHNTANSELASKERKSVINGRTIGLRNLWKFVNNQLFTVRKNIFFNIK